MVRDNREKCIFLIKRYDIEGNTAYLKKIILSINHYVVTETVKVHGRVPDDRIGMSTANPLYVKSDTKAKSIFKRSDKGIFFDVKLHTIEL